MVQVLQARDATLRDLIDRFGLQRVQDSQFFHEWQESLPEITELERQYLDKVKAGYLNLIEYPPLLEKTIQFSIVSPILFLADFFLPPFHVCAEESIEISDEDEEVSIRGQIDILLLKERFWLLVIESKRAFFSIEAGLAQLLAYMLANPQKDQPGFGMITTGGSFTFVKLIYGNEPQYNTSKIFELRNPGNELYDVFQILKRISQL
jgi:hypothetical protein